MATFLRLKSCGAVGSKKPLGVVCSITDSNVAEGASGSLSNSSNGLTSTVGVVVSNWSNGFASAII